MSNSCLLRQKTDNSLAVISLYGILMTLTKNIKHLIAIRDSILRMLLREVQTFLFEILLSTTSLRFIPKILRRHLMWNNSNKCKRSFVMAQDSQPHSKSEYK